MREAVDGPACEVEYPLMLRCWLPYRAENGKVRSSVGDENRSSTEGSTGLVPELSPDDDRVAELDGSKRSSRKGSCPSSTRRCPQLVRRREKELLLSEGSSEGDGGAELIIPAGVPVKSTAEVVEDFGVVGR
jgi:hypothetical protein